MAPRVSESPTSNAESEKTLVGSPPPSEMVRFDVHDGGQGLLASDVLLMQQEANALIFGQPHGTWHGARKR